VALGFALIALLGLNAFFVLAEFAIVKVRPSRVAELVAQGHRRARLLTQISQHLDEYLSVCQVGITLASVALGMVGEKLADIIMGHEGSHTRYVVAIAVSYVFISGSHILLGELVPKSVAIRLADRAALLAAWPLRLFHRLFFPALWLLTHMANAILRILGVGPAQSEESHSEQELRIILDRSQAHGTISFRRLLFMENVFDLGGLTARDAMRPKNSVRTLDVRKSHAENLAVVQSSRFTRYPLIDRDEGRPFGFLHLKDLVIRPADAPRDLRALARPLLIAKENQPLEALLAEMQRQRRHAALVLDPADEWLGLVTLEDVIEEIVGTIRDEFEDEEPIRLSDALAPSQVHFDIEAASPIAAVRLALQRMRPEQLPLSAHEILEAVEFRERLAGTYLGQGIGMPHARLLGLNKPFLMVLRSSQGIRCGHTNELGHLLFVLLTPAGQARVHQRLQSIIARLLNDSHYVQERLLSAHTADEVVELLRTSEQAVLT